jgi:hypothetical protein
MESALQQRAGASLSLRQIPAMVIRPCFAEKPVMAGIH